MYSGAIPYFAIILECAFTKTVHFKLNVAYFYGTPDGVTRQILGVNQQFPGPTLQASLGDLVIVTVQNNIAQDETLSMHWHGLEQVGSPSEDGFQGVTQCGIRFGQQMTYVLDLKQSGTYWWHSHHATQYTNGCWGILIVRNRPREAYSYDGELTFALSEWFHTPSHDLLKWYLSPESAGYEPVPDSVMINGKGVYPCDYARKQNRTCRVNSPNDATYTVEHGKLYRIRIINTGSMTNFNFSIDQHQLETIEVDGVDTVKVKPVDVVRIFSGQRFSFLVRMTAGAVGSTFWIRSKAFVDAYNVSATIVNEYPEAFFRNDEAKAILQYVVRKPTRADDSVTANKKGDLEIKPGIVGVQGRPATHDWEKAIRSSAEVAQATVFQPIESALDRFVELGSNTISSVPMPMLPSSAMSPTTNGKGDKATLLDHNDCRPINGDQAYNISDQLVELSADFFLDENGITKSGFNRVSFTTGPEPVLSLLIYNKTLPATLNPVITPLGTIVQIVVNSPSARGHPIHLHGHTFWVVGSGPGAYNDAVDRSKLIFNGTRRDTTTVGPYGWVAMRYLADNPGPWLMHCHYNWHLNSGLGMVFIEGEAELRRNPSHFLTPEYKRVCEQ